MSRVEHRATVLAHLVDAHWVTAEGMHAVAPELPAEGWAGVLDGMCRVGGPRRSTQSGRQVPPARLLHVVAGDPETTTYALAPDGWAAARRGTTTEGTP